MGRGSLGHRRGWLAGLGSGAIVVALGMFAPFGGVGSASAGTTTEATQPVIVVLSDQVSDQPPDAHHVTARRARTSAAQRAVLGRLSGPKPSKVKNYTAVNGFAATVTAAQAAALAADPAVAAVIPDTKVAVAPAPGAPDPASGGQAKTHASSTAPKVLGPQVCPADPAKPLLEPEALQVTRTATTDGSPSAQQLVDGSGVKVAFIADGLDPNNPDFIRPDGTHVFADYQDFSGDGPNAPSGGAEAFGDASSIAAQGRQVYDLANFVNPAHPLPPGCNIRIRGMAPGATLVGLKAGGNLLPNSAILQAIDYAVTVAHVDVLNESFGANMVPDSGAHNTIQLFDQAAVAAGVTVTASTGDGGITGTIGNPSTDPGVISVGGSTTFRLYEQTTYGAAQFSSGRWADNNISALSSAGITQGGRTMDLVAPGEAGWALCSTSPEFSECTNFAGAPSPIQAFGGTSQSAPLTAGAAALVIQAYRLAHHGNSPSPALVKQILTSTAHDLGLPAEEQGAGLLDTRAAVEAASTAGNPGLGTFLASNVLVSPNQVNLTGNPGQHKTVDVSVTNVGGAAQTVNVGTRDFAPQSDARQTVQVNSSTDPTYVYSNGQIWAFKEFTFHVPAGADRLGATIAWPGAAKQVGSSVVTPVVRLTLLDPSGTYEGDSRPQGGPASANHAFVDIRKPPAGTWTGILYTVAGPGGLTGPVLVDTSTQRAVAAGSVSPASLHLAPGQRGTFHVHLTTPASGGDATESITVHGSGGHTTSIPVILRALVPTSGGRGTFTGTITGGNARAFTPAQSFAYAFDVPAGRHDVGVGLKLAKDPNVVLEGVLVDPDGEPVVVSTNATYNSDGSVGTGRGLQATFANPLPGRWRFVLLVQNPVSGNEIAQNFTGVVAFDRVSVHASGALSGGTVPAGKAGTATVRYTNTGAAPQAVQLDARTQDRRDLTLAPQFGPATIQLPLTPTSPVPAYLIPPGTDRAALAADSTTPAQVEFQAPTAGIDVFGDLPSAQAGSTHSVARIAEKHGHPVAPGYWFIFVQEIGPFSGPAPAATSVLSATAHTQGFNRDITSDVGDPYLGTVDPSAPFGNPAIVQPGQTVTITVAVTPHGAKGSHVDGTLYLVTTPIGEATFNTSGDTLAAIPYQYTVK